MKPIEINTSTDLLNFINRKDITPQQATKVVSTALNVICLDDYNKEELIKETKLFIEKYFVNSSTEKPIFFGLNLDTK